MKLSQLALAAALTAVSFSFPLAARSEGGGKDGDVREEMGDRRMRQDDREEGRGDRREGMEGRDGPRGPRDMDPEMKVKLDKMRELELKAVESAKRLRQGTDAEKAAAKNELRKTIGELFDAKLSLETAMLDRMEKHAAELKAKIAKKKASREKAIESRFARMSGEGDEWD